MIFYISEFSKHEVNDAVCWSGSIIVAHFTIDKEFDGREALNLYISAFFICIDGCDVSDAFEGFGCFLVLRG